jgi:ACT domain-containing protein
MILLRIKFFDGRGALSRIMEALSGAGVNIEKSRFDADKERLGIVSSGWVGRGIIVVKDEERDIVLEKIDELEKKRRSLGLEIVGMYYDVTIALPNLPGALAGELVKLAKIDVDIRHAKTRGKNENGEVLVNLIFECSPEQYNLAKQALGRTIQDESPFDPNIISDSI